MNYSEIVINGIIETQNAQNDYGVFVKYMISNYDKANKEYQTLDSFFIGCLNVYDDMIRDIENQFFESQKDLKGMIKDIKDDLKIKKYPDELHKEAKEIELNFATKQLESLNYDGFSFSVSHYTANKHRGYLKMDAIVYLKTRTVELYETLKKQTENPTTPQKPQQSSKVEEETNIPIVTTIDSEKPEPRFNFTETQINGLHYNLTNEKKCITTIENFKAICKGAKKFDKIEWIGSLQKLNAFCRWLTDNRDKNPTKGFVNEFFKIKGKANLNSSNKCNFTG